MRHKLDQSPFLAARSSCDTKATWQYHRAFLRELTNSVMRNSWRFCVGTASVGTLACGAAGSYVWIDEAPEEVFRAQAATALSVGDVVGVRVFGQEPLSVRERVRADGVLVFPLIGDMIVDGRAPSDVAKEVEKRLQPFVNDPHVTVVVEETHLRVTVLGEVRRPGTVELNESAGLFEALAIAGGLTEFASESRVFVLRKSQFGSLRIRFEYGRIARGEGRTAMFRLHQGDQIVVD
jgi:polysaccharide biosynthesis/export protein